MTDSTLNRFIAYGTNAQRLAFTPSVPTPASGPSQAYTWYETDTGLEYVYAAAAWHLIGGTGVGNVAGPGSSTDRAVATWNSTSGVLLRDNSAVTIDASGNITTSGKATITGNVSGGNLTTAGVVSATGNVSGGNLTTAGNVTGANIGNITPTNLNGNGSTVLLGNGTFGVVPGGSGGGLTLLATSSPTGTNVITFSSISASYTNLLVTITARSDANSAALIGITLTLNNDSSAIYDVQALIGSGSTASSAFANAAAGFTAAYATPGNGTTSWCSNGKIDIFDYAGTTLFKTGLCNIFGARATGSGNMTVDNRGWQYRSTSAINRIDLTLASGNYVAGTKVNLYGIS